MRTNPTRRYGRILTEQHSNITVWLTSSSIRFRFRLNVEYKYRVEIHDRAVAVSSHQLSPSKYARNNKASHSSNSLEL